MRILYTAQTTMHIATLHKPVLDRLVASGCSIHIATGTGPLPESYPDSVSWTYHEGLCRPGNSSGLADLASIFASTHFDAVIACGHPAVDFTRKAVKKSSSRPATVVTVDPCFAYDDSTRIPFRLRRRGRVRSLAAFSDLVLVSNSWERREIERMRLGTKTISAPLTGIDSRIHVPDQDERECARAEAQCPESSFLVVMDGPFDRLHAQRFIIDSMLYLPRSIELHMLGSGDGLKRCRKRLFELGLEDNVHIHEDASWSSRETVRLLEAADMVLDCSRSVGFPHLVARAQSMGVPVLASSTAGNIELVRNGLSGLTYTIGDTLGFIGAMRAMMYGDDFRTRVTSAALAGSARFDGRVLADAAADAILEILNVQDA